MTIKLNDFILIPFEHAMMDGDGVMNQDLFFLVIKRKLSAVSETAVDLGKPGYT